MISEDSFGTKSTFLRSLLVALFTLLASAVITADQECRASIVGANVTSSHTSVLGFHGIEQNAVVFAVSDDDDVLMVAVNYQDSLRKTGKKSSSPVSITEGNVYQLWRSDESTPLDATALNVAEGSVVCVDATTTTLFQTTTEEPADFSALGSVAWVVVAAVAICFVVSITYDMGLECYDKCSKHVKKQMLKNERDPEAIRLSLANKHSGKNAYTEPAINYNAEADAKKPSFLDIKNTVKPEEK